MDVSYPDWDRIQLVMDNRNTNALSSLYKAFPAPKACKIAKKLEIHYTRKHGSDKNWRNRMNHFLKQELTGWKKSEAIWLCFATLTILTLSLYWKDSAVGIMAAITGGLLLSRLGGNLPYVDSTSTVLSVVAQILCVRRYREQWLLWIVVNVVTVIMWIFAFWNGGESVAALLMWSIYLINAVIMYQKWSKEAKMCDIK